MSIFLETSKRRAEMLREWRKHVQQIARVIKELLPDAQIYVTGSTIRGDQVGGSDVDILVISPSTPRKPIEKAKIKAQVEEKLNLPPHHPFEIHILTPQEAQPYLEKTGKHIQKIT